MLCFLHFHPLFSRIVAGLLVLGLAGCGAVAAQPTVTPVPSHTPSLTPTASATPSLTYTLTPSQTASPLPSFTPSLTSSPTAAATFTPTLKISSTPTATPQPDAESNSLRSPDGQWLVQGPGSNSLSIVRADGRVHWLINFLGQQSRYTYRVAAWSKDGLYAYVGYVDGYKENLLTCKAEGIKRLDLRDGTLTTFLEFKGIYKTDECWNFAFSPDGLKIAYIQPSNPLELVVVDMASGGRLTYAFDKTYTDAGLIQWGPDQKQVIVVAARQEKTVWKSTLFWVKIEDKILNVQDVFSQSDLLIPQEWKGDRVVLSQTAVPDKLIAMWEIYLSSQTVLPLRATITPTPVAR